MLTRTRELILKTACKDPYRVPDASRQDLRSRVMKVASIMTEKPFKVRMDDSIGTIREILENVEFHHLLVVEGRKLVGIMSSSYLKWYTLKLNSRSKWENRGCVPGFPEG